MALDLRFHSVESIEGATTTMIIGQIPEILKSITREEIVYPIAIAKPVNFSVACKPRSFGGHVPK
jgi:hypothetical protein